MQRALLEPMSGPPLWRVRGVAAAMLLLAAARVADAAEAPALTIVHAGTLLALPGEPARSRQSVLVRAGKIAEIREGYVDAAAAGEPAQVIDLSDAFVMPGFIDLHVHLSGETGDDGRDLVAMRDADVALLAAMYAERTLLAGFTTVRDLGSRGDAIFALRDAIRAGRTRGPRILASGDPITPSGGHGDVHGYRPEVLEALPARGVCDGPEECRRAVRRAVKRGADVIKVTATGGVLSETATGTGQQFTDAELAAIVQAAHALGRKVTAHAHAKAGIEAALRAGFDSIEHAMWADAETMQHFRKTGAWLVPTVYPITYVGDTPEKVRQGPFKDLPPPVMEKLLRLGRQPKDMTRLAHRTGVNIALGTDSGVSPHGENAHEFIEYAQVGMTPMQALRAGTVDAAEAAGIGAQTGSLVPGKAADLVALRANPLENIGAVLEVRFVMRDGLVFKHEAQAAGGTAQ